MDIHCVKCGEPIDLMELHDIPGKTWRQAKDAFFTLGCEGIGMTCSEPPSNPKAANISSIAHDLLGDDIDAIAGMMEDAEIMGLL